MRSIASESHHSSSNESSSSITHGRTKSARQNAQFKNPRGKKTRATRLTRTAPWESKVRRHTQHPDTGLTSILTDEAPASIKQFDIKTLFGRKVAIDASMSLYQFLIAVRQADGQQMMTDGGEVTSHLLGFFYRTLRMIDFGIKPVYVFDGKPPDLKKDVVCCFRA